MYTNKYIKRRAMEIISLFSGLRGATRLRFEGLRIPVFGNSKEKLFPYTHESSNP
jgi:hypothetical protein